MDLATGQSIHVAEGFGPVWLNDHTLIIEMLAKSYDPATEARVAQAAGGERPSDPSRCRNVHPDSVAWRVGVVLRALADGS